jgi:peroxiredoxin
MKIHGTVASSGCAILSASLALMGPPGFPGAGAARAQDAKAESVEAIDRDYEQGVLRLEKARLEKLAGLAARQPKEEAAKTYEVYLSSAAGRGLFAEAEPVAEKVLAGDPAPRLAFFAHVVNVIAEVKRGDYEKSLASLSAAHTAHQKQVKEGDKAAPPLSVPERLALIEIYYQSLLQADQFDVARKALTLIRGESRDPAVQEYLDRRLARLAMIGKSAPAIEGTDVDGKPFRLADWKGNPVLVVFWASWDLPDAERVEAFREFYRAHKGRGLRVVGINVDALQDGGREASAVLPEVRRFLIEHNVTWPNLISEKGAHDYAKAYGVTEVPSNFIVGRDGTINHLDVTGSHLERALLKALGR